MPQLDFSVFLSQVFWSFVSFGSVYFFIAKFFIPFVAHDINSTELQIQEYIDKSALILEQVKMIQNKIEKIKTQTSLELHHLQQHSRQMIFEVTQDYSKKANQIKVDKIASDLANELQYLSATKQDLEECRFQVFTLIQKAIIS